MSSLSQTMLVPPLAPASAVSSAPAAARRSGAKGCGVSAAAVERASDGASMRAAKLFAVLAVGTITTARLLPSASAMMRSIMRMRSSQREAEAQPLSTTMATGPVPSRPASREGFRTGSASAKMSSAAASRRSSVNHHGEAAGVFPGFRGRRGCASGGNVTWCGLGEPCVAANR